MINRRPSATKRPYIGPLSAPATSETSGEPSVGKAKVPDARMEETRVSKAEAAKTGVEETWVGKAEAPEPWAKEGTSETAIPTAAKSDGNAGGPSPAPRPAPAPGISPIPIIGVRISVGIRGRHLRFRRERRHLGEQGRGD